MILEFGIHRIAKELLRRLREGDDYRFDFDVDAELDVAGEEILVSVAMVGVNKVVHLIANSDTVASYRSDMRELAASTDFSVTEKAGLATCGTVTAFVLVPVVAVAGCVSRFLSMVGLDYDPGDLDPRAGL